MVNSEEIPVIPGSSKDYIEILPNVATPDFDRNDAVDFIIQQALKDLDKPLWIVPIGTLTNEALAIAKAPEIHSSNSE